MLPNRAIRGVALVPACLVMLACTLSAQTSHRPPYKRPPSKTMPAGVPGTQVDVISSNQEWNSGFEGQQPGKKPPSITSDKVDVINGSARQTQVFSVDQPAAASQRPTGQKKAAKRRAQEKMEAAPQIPDVEVINGAQLETRRFEGAEDEITTPWIERRSSQPVVIGVATVTSANERGSAMAMSGAAPIVIGVASSESERHGENAKPIAYRIAPGPPKRPPYHDPPGN